MPIYEYECDACGETFEAIQKFSDDPLTECRLCEKGPVNKLISAAAFHLKGGGWYVTDFRDKDKGKGKKTGDAASSESSGSSSSKSSDSSSDKSSSDSSSSSSSSPKAASAD